MQKSSLDSWRRRFDEGAVIDDRRACIWNVVSAFLLLFLDKGEVAIAHHNSVLFICSAVSFSELVSELILSYHCFSCML